MMTIQNLRKLVVQTVLIVMIATSPVHLQSDIVSNVTCHSVHVLAGQAVNLTCTYSPANAGLYAISWRHSAAGQSKQVYRYDARNGNGDPSNELKGRSDYFHFEGSTTLSILNITEDEDGTYSCEIEANKNRKTGLLELTSYYNASGRVDFGPSVTIKTIKGSHVDINITANCTKPAVNVHWSEEEYALNHTIPCEASYAETTFSTYFRKNVTSSFNVTARAAHPSFANGQIKRNFLVLAKDIIISSAGPSTNILGSLATLEWTFEPKWANIQRVKWLYRAFREGENLTVVYEAEVGKPGTAYGHLVDRANYTIEERGKIALVIANLSATDDGQYTCQVFAVGTYQSEMNLTTQSESSSCIEWDANEIRNHRCGDTVVIFAKSLCCKPAVEFQWQYESFTEICQCDDTKYSSVSIFIKENVVTNFEVTVQAKHNGIEVSNKTYHINIYEPPKPFDASLWNFLIFFAVAFGFIIIMLCIIWPCIFRIIMIRLTQIKEQMEQLGMRANGTAGDMKNVRQDASKRQDVNLSDTSAREGATTEGTQEYKTEDDSGNVVQKADMKQDGISNNTFGQSYSMQTTTNTTNQQLPPIE